MTKTFCDMCGKPAARANVVMFTRRPKPRPEGFDKTARIRMSLSFYYVDHSTGYGGPPDLCKRCKTELFEEMLDAQINV